jgi:tRNA(Ile2) C34 agmatinyltransferase TiaS
MRKALFALCISFALCIAVANASFATENALEAQDVVKSLDENRMKFDMQYKNKEITIKGTIAKIEEKKGKYILSLSNGEKVPNPFKFIECTFDKPDELMDLKKGDEATVSGAYKGKQSFEVGAMTLFKCKLVK